MLPGPTVSVIIPFLNAEKFLEEAIESVFGQSYPDWELLLIDDGSADSSSTIARRKAAAHADRVRYIEHHEHQNRGSSCSRNVGMANAAGRYFAFLDADDVWFPQKLAEQIELFDRHSAVSVVYGGSQYWRSWSGDSESGPGDFVPPRGLLPAPIFHPPTLLTLNFPLGNAEPPSLSDLIVRREVISRTGGFDELFCGIYQLYEDQAFLAKIYLHENVHISDQIWDRYRLHSDSCCAIAKRLGTHSAVRRFYLEWLSRYLIQQGVKDENIWRAVRRALFPYHHPLRHRLKPKNIFVKARRILDSTLPGRKDPQAI